MCKAVVLLRLQNCRQRELRLVRSQHHISAPQLDGFDIEVVPLD